MLSTVSDAGCNISKQMSECWLWCYCSGEFITYKLIKHWQDKWPESSLPGGLEYPEGLFTMQIPRPQVSGPGSRNKFLPGRTPAGGSKTCQQNISFLRNVAGEKVLALGFIPGVPR